MPTYDYVCQDCGHAFEHFQSMTSDLLKTCPQCQKDALKRLIGAGGALIFKGSGFYITDYKKSGGAGTSKVDEGKLDDKVARTKEAAKDVKASQPAPAPSTPSSSTGGS